jgi:hypothetical protein
MASWGRLVSLAMVGALIGCAGSQTKVEEKPKPVHPVVKQASFDLNCPRPELRYLQIAPDQWGAVGCGKRARYKRHCQQRVADGHGVRFEDHCSWMLDSPILANDAPSEPQPAAIPGESL